MADVPPEEGFLQQQLECSICLSTYNLEARTPTALKCQHTFCKRCVDTLATKPPLTCPKCKRRCEIENLVKNFALCDVLEQVCESCNSREKHARCHHCPQYLCATCLAAHDQTFQGDVQQNLDELRQEVRKSSDLTSDDSVLNKERARAAAAIEQIQKKIQTYQDEIKKLEAKLKNKVIELKKLNVENYAKWQQIIDMEVAKCKAFLRKSEGSFESSTEARNILAETNTKALEFLSILQDYHKSTPTLIEYTFVESQSAPDVGEITVVKSQSALEVGEITSPPATSSCQSTSAQGVSEFTVVKSQSAPEVGKITSPPATSSHQPTLADYTHARSVAVSGSQGSEPEEFANNAYVTCTDHSYIVSDTQNHRLKVYDTGLNLMFVFGEQGDQKHQFNRPTGLCVSPSGELYVSDSLNDRIKIYDKDFQFVRTFGSRGSGKDKMNEPMGLAFTQTGQLLVVDTGNHRVKVLGADGSYICTIGSKGQGPGQFANRPVSVAATPDGHVLVNEGFAATLLMFTLDGAYVRAVTPSIPKAPQAIRIWGFTTDCQGNIIIADTANNQLIVLDSLGQLTCVVGKPGDQPGKLLGPMSVALNSKNIVVYEAINKRVQLFKM